MRRTSLLLVLALAATLLVLPAAGATAGEVRVVRVGTYDVPLLVTAPPGDDRLYVVERAGRIIQVTLGADGRERSRRTFADLRSRVGSAGEGGLLGLAFSPDHARDRRLWVAYTDRDSPGDLVVERYTTTTDRTRIVGSSRTRVIEVQQPASNHNGGMIAFARDGMLLVGLGDGGGSGDPRDRAQDTGDLLGSILRLDVVDRTGSGYAIPPDNPFVGRSGRDEIWAYGLRNPWRFSVDPLNGDVWIGDVGQDAREEADRLPYRPSRAFNLGWDCFEGSRAFEGSCTRSGKTFPVHEYGHGAGDCSITGGAVQRGPSAPAEAGDYVFADFCSGRVWAYDRDTDRARLIARTGRVFGSGQDAAGDVYLTTASAVLRVEGSGTRFRDVAAGSTFARDIERLAAAGITRGCNPPANDRFCPRDPVTREEMAAFIRRAERLPGAPEPFRDVASTDTFARDIGAIAAEGITRGCNPPVNDRFCPRDVVTRQQMAAFIVRGWGL